MHTFDDIIKAKKHLVEKGYDTESQFTLFKVAELMAEWAAINSFIPGSCERSKRLACLSESPDVNEHEAKSTKKK